MARCAVEAGPTCSARDAARKAGAAATPWHETRAAARNVGRFIEDVFAKVLPGLHPRN